MPVSNGVAGLGQGARVNAQYQGEGPSSTKASKAKPIMPQTMTGKLSYKKMIKDSNKQLPHKAFMPNIFIDAAKYSNKSKRGK